jgi:DNA-binding IclR family transcriptional regulator
MLPAQPNQSLIDGLALLQTLATREEPVGSRELARAVGMEPTRVNRLLKTLAHLGLAEQGEDRRYRPGPGMHVLSAQALHASGLMRRAIGPLEELHRYGHLVAMGVLWQTSTCYLYHASPGMNAAMALGRSGLRDATTSGLGMVLLAHLKPQRLGELYPGEVPAFASLAALKAALDPIRREGFAYVRVHDPKTYTLAVPVGAAPYAAIAFSGDIKRSEVSRLAAALRAVAERIDAAVIESDASK